MLIDREILGRDGKTPSREERFSVCVFVCGGRDSCTSGCRGNFGINGDVSGLVYFRN